MADILLIESLLAELRLALDQLLLDESAVAPEALADLVARIDGEIEAADRVELKQSEIVTRFEPLRSEIDRHLARH
jgi:hypothetical protein